MTTYHLSNTCTCENEDGTYPAECFGCYDDDKSNLKHALDAWIDTLELSHVEIQGRNMGWMHATGSTTIDATADGILDMLRLNGEYRLEIDLPEGDDAEFDFTALRYSHDEPTGATFNVAGLTTCTDSDCTGECNSNFCENFTD